MNGKFVLDTNVIIDYLNGQEELKPLSEQIASGVGLVSVIPGRPFASSRKIFGLFF